MSEAQNSEASQLLVQDWMTRDPICVSTSDDLARAYRVLAENAIRHLPVVSGKRRLVGILTKRDLLALTRSGGANAAGGTTVSMVMTTEIVTVRPDEPLRRAAELLARHKYGCIPVTNDKREVVGIVTEHDFVRWFLARS